MKFHLRSCGLPLLLLFLTAFHALGQSTPPQVAEIVIKHVGPQNVSDELIRSHIRVKVGDPYLRPAVDEDVRNLYGTGLFYLIRIAEEIKDGKATLTYVVQGNPRLMDIRLEGNKKIKTDKLRKKLTSKVGEPFNERKLFTDAQELEKHYQKKGYPRTKVEYLFSIDEPAGRATATFKVSESPKRKILRVEFEGAQAFTQKKLRKVVKTSKHWMFSWLIGSGYLKDEDLEEDREKLVTFYRDNGYIDFELKDIVYEDSDDALIVKFLIYEGHQYRVGSIKFEGNTVISAQQLTNGIRAFEIAKGAKGPFGPNGLSMDVGHIFTPKGLTRDIEAIEDFYGSKGYIDVSGGTKNLIVSRIANVERGTMDLLFKIEEGQKSYLEKIQIRGNTKTRDRVIRRELAVSPGEVFDMVKVKRSKQRLEGLQFFDKVDARPEPTDIPNRQDLVVAVEEKNTGNLTLGAGFSSVDSIVGFAEVSQGNFDLFHPPTFTGGGQKFRLRVQMGTERQDYVISFIEPWFLGRKLALGVDLYYRKLGYESIGNIYDVSRAGGRVSLTRALGSDFLIGSVSYTLENLGILLNDGYYGSRVQGQAGQGPFGDHGSPGGPGPGPTARIVPGNVPDDIAMQDGYHLLSRLGTSLAYDTRNSVQLPNHGQRTELGTELVGGPLGGNEFFYKLELKTAWYFPGLFSGHVLEIIGRTGVAKNLQSGDVPFYDRYYLGGLYSLRGFHYRSISPRQEGYEEPIGGDTYWFGSAEYSIPIMPKLRFALFYDVGCVAAKPYDYTDLTYFNSNWGLGIRFNLPIGPLRLDYGVPITYDQYNSGGGRFQFGVGYTREF